MINNMPSHRDFQSVQDLVPFPVIGISGDAVVYRNPTAVRHLPEDVAHNVENGLVLLDKVSYRDNSGQEISYFFFKHASSPEKEQFLLDYLNQAARELTGARDMKTVLHDMARLIVPAIADWLTIDVMENGELHELMIYTHDPEKLEWAHAYRSAHPIALTGERSRAQVVRSGEPVLISHVPEGYVLTNAQDIEHPYIQALTDLRSLMTVPVRNRTSITGAIRLLSVLPGRHYDEAYLKFAENFAAHAGLVIENARLHEAAEQELAQRKLTERVLRLTQLRLQSALSSGLAGTWILDLSTRKLFPDENLCRMFGLPFSTEGIDQTLFLTKIYPGDSPLIGKDFVGTADTTKQYETEYRVITDRGIRWLLARGQVQKDDPGYRIMTGITVDITERKETERELKESNERYSAAFQNASVGILLSDIDGLLLKANAAFTRITGFTEADLAGADFTQITHPHDVQHNLDLYGRLFSGKIPFFVLEKRYRHRQGHYIWVRNSSSMVRDGEDKPAYAITITEDITDQKRAEDELAAREAHFKALTQLNSLPIWQVNNRCEMIFVNDTWRTYTGVQNETIKEEDWAENIHPEDRSYITNYFNKLFALQEPVSLKYRFKHAPSETYRWVLDTAQPVFDPDFQGYIGTMTDIDDQEQARLRIQEQMVLKDEFISVASHELKTPMTTLKAFFQLLARDMEKTQQVNPFLEKAGRQLERLERLIADLLDVSRINAGKMPYNFAPFNLTETLHEVIAGMQAAANNHLIQVKCEDAIWLNGDRQRIEQVIINLLNNALKYSPANSPVTISCRCRSKQVSLTVADKGIGIPAEHLENLFDRFYQVEPTSNRFAGLGLGLFISNEIVKGHGGRISVKSKPGQGASFTVLLPLAI